MKRWLIAMLTVLAAAGWSPASAVETPLSRPTKQFFALSVPDAVAAAAWYGKVLGVEQIADLAAPDGTSRTLVMASDAYLVELVQHKNAKSRNERSPDAPQSFLTHGIFKVGVFVADFDQAVAHFRALGIGLFGEILEDRGLGIRFFLVRDVGGNVLQVYGTLPPAELPARPAETP